MGQSEIEHIINSSSYFNQFPKPNVSKSNAVIITQVDPSDAPIKTVVTQSAVDAGNVSYSMAALAEILGNSYPDTQFIIGDGCVSGTSRKMLADDTNTGRIWSDFTSVVNLIEADYGEIQHLVECWYNADAAYIQTFKDSFWPLYFGINPDGTEFTLGTTFAGAGGYQVDHCLWDYLAASTDKGRGIFKKSVTSWHMLTPMPFNDGPVTGSPALQFTQGLRNEEPTRQTIKSLELDSVSQSVNLKTGPSAHVTDFNGDIHPLTDDKNGNILFMYPFSIPMLRAAGTTVGEPQITAIGGPEDGSYIDLTVTLPNDGTLTTIRQLRGEADPVAPSPHQQIVTGLEVFRSSEATRSPIYKTTEAVYPQVFRGTVTIQDSGSGTPKTGKVRVTPESAFQFGDSLSYLRGQATALLLESRDVPNKPFLDMIIEHVPALYDASATYPMEGIAVAPLQTDLAAPVAAPPFVRRGVYSDGVNDGFIASNILDSAGQGLISLWFNNHDSDWAQLKYLLQLRSANSATLQLSTTSSRRLNLRLEADSSLLSKSFYSTSLDAGFLSNEWYHILISYQSGSLVVYVNNEEVLNDVIGSPFTSTSDDQGFLSESILRNQANADYAHLWMSTTQTIDITQQSNRNKFALSNVPIDLGPNGQLPTGTMPEYYFDGNGNAWNNNGSVGPLTLSGSLDISATKPTASVIASAGLDKFNVESGAITDITGTVETGISPLSSVSWQQVGGAITLVVADANTQTLKATAPTVDQTTTFKFTAISADGLSSFDLMTMQNLAFVTPDNYSIVFRGSKNTVIKSFKNRVIFDFDYDLTSYVEISISFAGESYSTVANPSNVYVQDLKSLVLNVGQTTNAASAAVVPKIIADGVMLNGECKRILESPLIIC